MPDPNESKEARFKRLASKRVSEALKRITLIGKLSNRSSYGYSDEQVQQIVNALREEINRVEEKFTSKSHAASSGFSL